MKKLLSFLSFSFVALALVLPSSVFAAVHVWGEPRPTGASTNENIFLEVSP